MRQCSIASRIRTIRSTSPSGAVVSKSRARDRMAFRRAVINEKQLVGRNTKSARELLDGVNGGCLPSRLDRLNVLGVQVGSLGELFQREVALPSQLSQSLTEVAL